MTLLLSVITARHAVQASDRRVTYAKGEVGDTWNKAALLDVRGSVAFAGLARLNGDEPTDEFVMGVYQRSLVDGSPFISSLREAASVAVRSNRALRPLPSRDRRTLARTAVIVCGFGRVPDVYRENAELVEPWTPTLTVISSAHRDLSQRWRDTADAEFSAQVTALQRGEPYCLHSCGQELRVNELQGLHRSLRQAALRCVDPQPLGRLLARTIRTVAARNSAVGDSVMVVYTRREPLIAGGANAGRIANANVPVGARACDYERATFESEGTASSAFLAGKYDTPGVYWFPGSVSRGLMTSAVVAIHESVDQGSVLMGMQDRDSMRRRL